MKHVQYIFVLALIFLADVLCTALAFAPQDDTVKMGDLEMTKQQYNYFYTTKAFSRYGLKVPRMKWPDGKVPIMIDPSAGFSPEFVAMFKDAANDIMGISCVVFEWVNSPPQGNYIKIVHGAGCSAHLGCVNKGMQFIKFPRSKEENECASKSNAIHEMMHALGFIHMMSAPNRDEYIEILWDNIEPDLKSEFEKLKNQPGDWYGTEFDFDSIMFYESGAGGINPDKDTYKLKKPHSPPPGTLNTLSAGDIARINNMYCKDNDLKYKILKDKDLQDNSANDKNDLKVDSSSGDKNSESKQQKRSDGAMINININAHG